MMHNPGKAKDVCIAGVMLSSWYTAFISCNNVDARNGLISFCCWPNGGSYLEQESIVVEMFSLIKGCIYRTFKNG